MTSIATALASIKKDIGRATLIAVSKTQNVEAIQEALEAGQRVFGENRVQEAKRKFATLRAAYPDIELHLIGALQTNKAEEAIKTFDVIQTVDRPELAEALKKAITKLKKTPRLYIEVNLGEEPQKSGVAPEGAEALLFFCRNVCGLEISGLMSIPPYGKAPEPYFERLVAMAEKLGLPHRSIGMSSDYRVAIQKGATEVRIGTLIFGERTKA